MLNFSEEGRFESDLSNDALIPGSRKPASLIVRSGKTNALGYTQVDLEDGWWLRSFDGLSCTLE